MGIKSKDKVHIAIKYVNKEIKRNEGKTFTASRSVTVFSGF